MFPIGRARFSSPLSSSPPLGLARDNRKKRTRLPSFSLSSFFLLSKPNARKVRRFFPPISLSSSSRVFTFPTSSLPLFSLPLFHTPSEMRDGEGFFFHYGDRGCPKRRDCRRKFNDKSIAAYSLPPLLSGPKDDAAPTDGEGEG